MVLRSGRSRPTRSRRPAGPLLPGRSPKPPRGTAVPVRSTSTCRSGSRSSVTRPRPGGRAPGGPAACRGIGWPGVRSRHRRTRSPNWSDPVGSTRSRRGLIVAGAGCGRPEAVLALAGHLGMAHPGRAPFGSTHAPSRLSSARPTPSSARSGSPAATYPRSSSGWASRGCRRWSTASSRHRSPPEPRPSWSSPGGVGTIPSGRRPCSCGPTRRCSAWPRPGPRPRARPPPPPVTGTRDGTAGGGTSGRRPSPRPER